MHSPFRRWAMIEETWSEEEVKARKLDPPSEPSKTVPRSAALALVALYGGRQVVNFQQRQLFTLRNELERSDADAIMLRAALQEAEARLESARIEIAAREHSAPRHPSCALVVEERQVVEALALELDLLNWALGEGTPFSRRAFWREALPRGVAMLQASGELFEATCVRTAVWRPTIEVDGLPPAPPPGLERMVRRARDRVNMRLMKRRLPAAAGREGDLLAGDARVSPPTAFEKHGSSARLPPIPLSLVSLAADRLSDEDSPDIDSSSLLIVLVAPENTPLRCVNDGPCPLIIWRHQTDALLTVESDSECHLTEDENYVWAAGDELRFAVLRHGQWLEAVVRIERCDELSQYGEEVDAHIAPRRGLNGSCGTVRDEDGGEESVLSEEEGSDLDVDALSWEGGSSKCGSPRTLCEVKAEDGAEQPWLAPAMAAGGAAMGVVSLSADPKFTELHVVPTDASIFEDALQRANDASASLDRAIAAATRAPRQVLCQ